MKLVSTASSLPSVFQTLSTIVTKYSAGDGIIDQSRNQLLFLNSRYQKYVGVCEPLERRYTPDEVAVSQLLRFKAVFQEDIDRLIKWDQSTHEAECSIRMKQMEAYLSKCMQNVQRFDAFLLRRIIPMFGLNPSQPDEYIAGKNGVPENSRNLVLNYSTSSTYEGKLEAAVLDKTGGRVVAVFSPTYGLGKTCAMKGLAPEPQVTRAFPGGILYIRMGSDATIGSLLKEISNAVALTGGLEVAKKINSAPRLRFASDMASVWFRSYSCLFLVEDLCRVNGIDRGVLCILVSMVNQSSKLVYTTRDEHFLKEAHTVIEFRNREPNGDLSRRMLRKHADLVGDGKLDQSNHAAFESILTFCQGGPLALALAGGAVLNYSHRTSSDRKQDAWSEFYLDLLNEHQNVSDTSSLLMNRLSNIMDLSLRAIGTGYRFLFRSFCVLQKQQSIPDHVLKRLWNFDSLEDARKIIARFEEASLVQVNRQSICFSVFLHDLLLEIAIQGAVDENEWQLTFQNLLHIYIPYHQRNEGIREYWKLKDDGFIIRCLLRILRNASKCERNGLWQPLGRFPQIAPLPLSFGRELVHLLMKPQWITRRLVNDGIHAVERDVRYGEEFLEERLSGEFRNDVHVKSYIEHLATMRKAARLSCTCVAMNPRQVWFQLYARLLRHVEMPLTRAFLGQIERVAPKSWTTEDSGGLEAPSALVSIISSPSMVRCISIEDHEVWFTWGNLTDLTENVAIGVSCYNIETDICKITPFVFDEQHSEVKNCFHCSAFLADRNEVVTVHENQVIFWERYSGTMKKVVNLRYNNPLGIIFPQLLIPNICKYLALSSDGRRLATVSKNHEIQIWNTLNGEHVRTLNGHRDTVVFASFSADGTRIASTSEDCTVRVWDMQSGNGIVLKDSKTHVFVCVETSKDGARVVSASEYEICTWDARNGVSGISYPTWNQTVGVRSLISSADGKRILVGSSLGLLVLSDYDTVVALRTPHGHTDTVCSTSMSADEKYIASGSVDKTIRVYDAHNAEISIFDGTGFHREIDLPHYL